MGKDNPFPAVTMMCDGGTYPRFSVVKPSRDGVVDVAMRTDAKDDHQTIIVEMNITGPDSPVRVVVNDQVVWPVPYTTHASYFDSDIRHPGLRPECKICPAWVVSKTPPEKGQ